MQISAIPPIPPPETEEQASVREAVDAINELCSRLSFLPGVRGIAADLRVTLLSGVVTTVTTVGTVTTVTTVGTVTNQTNIGGNPAAPQIPALMNQAAILSNINNCSG